MFYVIMCFFRWTIGSISTGWQLVYILSRLLKLQFKRYLKNDLNNFDKVLTKFCEVYFYLDNDVLYYFIKQ